MQELLHGAGIVCIYYVVAASTMLTLRYFLKIPNELFRKILHFILLGSYIPFAFAFETWWLSVLLAIIMEILIYPILAWADICPGSHPLSTSAKAVNSSTACCLHSPRRR